MCEEILWNYLKRHCRGRRREETGAELARRLEISGNELRQEVNLLQRRGFPVGSSRTGYFCAVVAGEVYGTIRQLRQMAAIQGLEGHWRTFTPRGAAMGGRSNAPSPPPRVRAPPMVKKVVLATDFRWEKDCVRLLKGLGALS